MIFTVRPSKAFVAFKNSEPPVWVDVVALCLLLGHVLVGPYAVQAWKLIRVMDVVEHLSSVKECWGVAPMRNG
jgi:hypothetical protein